MQAEQDERRRHIGRAVQRVGTTIALVAATTLLLLGGQHATGAPVVFGQTGDIDITSSLPGNQGPATPYPSTITVPAGTPDVADLSVHLDGLSHNRAEHIDMLLVGPTGVARILVSDAGAGNSATGNANIDFVVSGSPAIPASGAIPSGTYVAANYGAAADTFAPPAPASSGVGLAGFVGTSPVGTWSLYIVDDTNGHQGSLLGWSLSLTTANNAPVADDDSYGVAEDDTLTVPGGTGVLQGDTDADSNPLAAGSPVGPSNGSLTLDADGSFTYTPDADFNGSDSFTYVVSDGNGGTDTGQVTVTVTAVNDPPIADDDSYTVAEDGTLTVPAGTGVLDGDTDADGDSLTADNPVGPTTGSIALGADGSFTYTPNAHFNGSDSFTYTVSDANGGTDTATVAITVTPVNDPPVATNDDGTVDAGASVVLAVTANDTDPDDDVLVVSVESAAARGQASCSTSSCTFTAASDDPGGAVTFTYRAADSSGASDVATVMVTVSPSAVLPFTAQATTTTTSPVTPTTATPASTTATTAIASAALPRTGAGQTAGLLALAQVVLGLGLVSVGAGTLLRTPAPVSPRGAGSRRRGRPGASTSNPG